ncbi:hypothetical protein D1007_54319 [Hordeum vulgare]|nr:hypothetical protein D1007_54319 [Hordeum vulgare]
MTMTLEDMAMIRGLPINILTVMGHVSAINRRAWVGDLIGVQPPLPLPRKADSSKVKHSWLKEVRGANNPCPADADEMVVQQYARAYLWYVLTKVVFTDATGNSTLWMYLELLRDWDTQYSWGSAALAYLYRQLDQASTRTKDTSSLCGFVCNLSLWMRERLSIGWPMIKNSDNPNPNPHEGLHDQDPYRRPTIAYCWDQVLSKEQSGYIRLGEQTQSMDSNVESERDGREFLTCVNDANVALSHPPGGALFERALRTTVEV